MFHTFIVMFSNMNHNHNHKNSRTESNSTAELVSSPQCVLKETSNEL